MLRYSRIYDAYQDWTLSNAVEVYQLTRCFLFFLFGSCVFYNIESSVDLCFLPILHNLNAISSYNWCGATLVHLYGCLDKVC